MSVVACNTSFLNLSVAENKENAGKQALKYFTERKLHIEKVFTSFKKLKTMAKCIPLSDHRLH